jgi:hypothetical protein
MATRAGGCFEFAGCAMLDSCRRRRWLMGFAAAEAGLAKARARACAAAV